jgi:hypothetical protein
METLTVSFGDKTKKAAGKITDRIKTFDDACRELGIDPAAMLRIETDDPFIGKQLNAIAAFTKLTIISRALNENWVPDWTDGNQRKWWPWFEWKSGFGFSHATYDHWHTHTNVGSRLCYKSEELAKYAATQFESIYQDFLTL